MKILVLNGPNLNLLGLREPDLYGRTTLEEIQAELTGKAAGLGVTLEFFQSNHEGELIDALHRGMGKIDGVIINPGGLTHTSLSLSDAIRSTGIPAVEVHISNIYAREEYRHFSFTASAAVGQVSGFGHQSYLLALEGLVGHLRRKTEDS